MDYFQRGLVSTINLILGHLKYAVSSFVHMHTSSPYTLQ